MWWKAGIWGVAGQNETRQGLCEGQIPWRVGRDVQEIHQEQCEDLFLKTAKDETENIQAAAQGAQAKARGASKTRSGPRSSGLSVPQLDRL